MTPKQGERIRVLVEARPNWDFLVSMAHRHGITPLFYWHLQRICVDSVPQNTLQRLRDHFYANAHRNLLLAAELIRILNIFGDQGVPVIPYKGVVLTNSLYGNLSLREFADLDILVHQMDVLFVKNLLLSSGYRPEFNLTRLQEASHLRTECEYNFILDDKKIRVEIHWDFAPPYFSCVLDHTALWKNAERTTLAGLEVQTLAPEDLLLVLCVHGGKHHWASIGWVTDLCELIYVHRGLDWTKVMDQAKRAGITKMLHLSLFLAANLLQADIPRNLLDKIRCDPAVKLLADQLRKNFFCEGNLRDKVIGAWRQKSVDLKMRERLRDRVQYCCRLLVALNVRDWSVISLPPVLFPLYYVIRPVRLAVNLFKRIWLNLVVGIGRTQGSQIK
ncbi:MAG: nucleotidyltransferase family protein [Ignavibacteriales bacterium]|nr:nucleotidyltransferase family protein [Ignavibacteriales bacterium]